MFSNPAFFVLLFLFCRVAVRAIASFIALDVGKFLSYRSIVYKIVYHNSLNFEFDIEKYLAFLLITSVL